MIAKGKAISHGANAIGYALREGKKGEFFTCNMIEGELPDDIFREMESVNQYSGRCKNKYLHFLIGIAPQDESKIGRAELVKICHEFSDRLGLDNNQ